MKVTHAALLAVMGCGSSTSVLTSAVGTFTLTNVDGHALPYTTAPGVFNYVARGTLALRDDGTFSYAETDSTGGQSTTSTLREAGRWIQTGMSISFQNESTIELLGSSGRIDGRTLTTLSGTHYLTFVRQ
jgi:hypothetical protein